MTRLPQKHSLVHQLCDILQEDLRAGRWKDWLPEERELGRIYQVSRCTVRSMLAQLRQAGVVETKHGLGTRAIAPSQRSTSGKLQASVGLLTSRSLDHFRHFVTMVVNDLHERLYDHGCQLTLHEHPRLNSARAIEFLAKLVKQHPHACWLLVGCSRDTQRWFSEQHIPAVVSGTCDAALGLPFVSLDNYALGRHAAMTMLQHGHRRIGALLTSSNSGLKSGLMDVLGGSPDAGSSFIMQETDEDAARVGRAVDRLLALSQKPTVIFIAESNLYLSACARLAQLRLRVPDDLSLLCRDDEPYLESLMPKPARYSKNPHLYAKRLLTFVLKTIGHEPLPHFEGYIMPKFVPGGSLRKVTPVSGT